MKNAGLTEKRMANKQFGKTERAILIAYYKFRDFPVAKKIARYANISRATLYRHHPSSIRIPKDYEEYFLKSFTKRIQKPIREDKNLRILFLRTLIFMSMNSAVLTILFKDGHQDIVKAMFHKFKDRILKEWHLAGDTEELYRVYENEILGVIEAWSEQSFSNQYLETTLNDILFLTKTSPHRLAGLIKQLQ